MSKLFAIMNENCDECRKVCKTEEEAYKEVARLERVHGEVFVVLEGQVIKTDGPIFNLRGEEV